MTPLDQVRKALEPFAHIADRLELDMPRALQRGENVIIHHPAHDPIPPVAFGRFIDAREALSLLSRMGGGDKELLVAALRQAALGYGHHLTLLDQAADRIALLETQVAEVRAAGFKRAAALSPQGEAKAWRGRNRYPRDPQMDANVVARDDWTYYTTKPDWADAAVADGSFEIEPLYASTPDARREREKIVAWLRDTPYVNIATYSASDFANAIERGEHMEAAASKAPEHVSASYASEVERVNRSTDAEIGLAPSASAPRKASVAALASEPPVEGTKP